MHNIKRVSLKAVSRDAEIYLRSPQAGCSSHLLAVPIFPEDTSQARQCLLPADCMAHDQAGKDLQTGLICREYLQSCDVVERGGICLLLNLLICFVPKPLGS